MYFQKDSVKKDDMIKQLTKRYNDILFHTQYFKNWKKKIMIYTSGMAAKQ